jgi:hypothetical protein
MSYSTRIPAQAVALPLASNFVGFLDILTLPPVEIALRENFVSRIVTLLPFASVTVE